MRHWCFRYPAKLSYKMSHILNLSFFLPRVLFNLFLYFWYFWNWKLSPEAWFRYISSKKHKCTWYMMLCNKYIYIFSIVIGIVVLLSPKILALCTPTSNVYLCALPALHIVALSIFENPMDFSKCSIFVLVCIFLTAKEVKLLVL